MLNVCLDANEVAGVGYLQVPVQAPHHGDVPGGGGRGGGVGDSSAYLFVYSPRAGSGEAGEKSTASRTTAVRDARIPPKSGRVGSKPKDPEPPEVSP